MGQGSATLISVAKDGHFGAVIVGTSLQDRFPEIQGVWGQRVIYTVYLHVGLRHSWILQYSLSPAMEASGGNIGRLEAPWPYTIVRPELAWEDTGAVIVSGLVDQSMVRRVEQPDGASRYTERYGHSWEELVDVLTTEGPRQLIDRVRQHDSASTSSGKQYDDASVVLLQGP